jgi:hypothetical protein
MPLHYNDSFYDHLDDITHYLGTALDDIEKQKDVWRSQFQGADDPQREIRLVKQLLKSTELAKTLPILDICIATISDSLLEKSKIFSAMDSMVKDDTNTLEECKANVQEALEQLDEAKKQADSRGETLLDYLEAKLEDSNIILLDTFYS